MITLNHSDAYLSRILPLSLRRTYLSSVDAEVYFYGIKKERDIDVMVRSMDELSAQVGGAIEALRRAGLSVHFAELEEVENDDDAYDGIKIGLGYRLRSDISVCRRVVITLLSAVLGDLNIDCSLTVRLKETTNV
jgi:hypothetical protein